MVPVEVPEAGVRARGLGRARLEPEAVDTGEPVADVEAGCGDML